MPGNGAVTRSTLRQQLADALRDEVLAGRLQPGQEFTVKEIAEQYGVSATPVREALVDLSAQGLLEADQHRGFRVHEYSLADYRGMIEARILVTDGLFRSLTGRAVELEQAGLGRAPMAAPAAGSPVVGTPAGGDPAVGAGDGASAAGAGAGSGSGASAGGTGGSGTGGSGAGESAGRESAVVGSLGHSVESPRIAAALAAVRRRGAEAQRAADAGELDILIGYDIRFWRELSVCYGNPYLTDFLHRLRVQCWVCVVQHLRRVPDLRGRLWAGHTELVDALARRDAAEAQAIITAYNVHSLALVEGLATR
ncbi:GntR family transcriptional regulator [Streptomyces cavernae]|uniref:GntR family transcriptional regulator n=1 Tax=Streptomyces cavernae TaxID=2259034 RepID=UPI000FEC02C7|nr:GntR family transcriptional regulator [Streptomyces cavernae]